MTDGYKIKRILVRQNNQEKQIYPAIPPRTFTITWTETSDPTQFNPVYSDDAAGLTAGSSAFDDFFGYSAVLLGADGVEKSQMAQSGGVFDDTMTNFIGNNSTDNVMIKFPRRGIKMGKSGSTVTLSITDNPNAEGYQYYAHTKGSDAKDVLYLGAYKMVSGYKSLSGASPLGNLTRDGFRQGIKSTYDSLAGTNRYSQISIYARWYINALYMMKYGNPNSQSVIGAGYTGGQSSPTNTGGTNSQTSASYGTSSNSQQVKLFGLEDWWGNVWEWLDCCYYNSSTQLTVDKTNSIFQDSAYTTNLGAISNGFMLGIDGSNDGMFKSVNGIGSATTYYTDYVDGGASSVLLAGGIWYTSAGAFAFSGAGPTATAANYGARLMYL